MKKRIIGIMLLAIAATLIITGCTPEKLPDPIPPVLPDTEVSEAVTDESYCDAYISIIEGTEFNYKEAGMECTYGLADINGDDIPELVTGHPTCISLYTYADGTVYTVMDEWSYGFGGNNGYEYLPGKNVIRNINSDMAGAMVYETYLKISENFVLEPYYEDSLYTKIWKEQNGNDMPDQEEIDGNTYYFYGENEITEEEYKNLCFGEGFSWLFGDMSYDEIIAELSEKN